MATCSLCNKPIIAGPLRAQFDIDDFIFCHHCFNLLLIAGLLFEGQDDEWHINDFDTFELLC